MKTETTIEKQFKEDCRVVSMDSEYPGHQEDIKWIIFSDIPEEAIRAKYREIIRQYEPCMFLGMEFYAPIRVYHNNERKHRWRDETSYDLFSYEDGRMERSHPELVYNGLESSEYSDLYAAIDRLPDKQKKRINQKYFAGMTGKEIAELEGVSDFAVSLSLDRAIDSLRNTLKENQ